MKLSEMKQILAERDLRLTKSLGQNFLHDGNQLRRMVAAADLTGRDKVLEIGPGLGPLTELLLPKAGAVLAIEKDRRLVEVIQQRLCGARNLILHLDDALKFLRRDSRDWSDWKLVSNLPYSVASPILVGLTQARACPARMVVTLQLEVAQRLLAQPGDPDYGLLTLLVQLHFQPRGRFRVPASCFFPAPEVDSTCVALHRRPKPLLEDHQAVTFTRIVKKAFSQRRKMMFKLLKEDWPKEKLADAFSRLKLPPESRAEEASLDQFVELTRHLE